MGAHTYHVDLEWTIDRKGEISSPVLDQKIEVATAEGVLEISKMANSP